MAKRKAQTSPKDAKTTKKVNQMKKDDSASWKEQYNVPETNCKGRNGTDDCKEDNVCQKVKIENLSPELMDENQKIKKEEMPNMELNRLLQSKSKLNVMGLVSWKTFLFPSILHKVVSPQKNVIILVLIWWMMTRRELFGHTKLVSGLIYSKLPRN